MDEKDVTLDSSPADKEEVANTEESSDNEVQEALADLEAKKPDTEKSEKGTKTPPENLYNALEEERTKRKEQAAKIEALEGQIKLITSQSSGELDGAESTTVAELQKQINALNEAREVDSLIAKFPQMADKRSEFDEFRKEYPGKLENVAKVFLAEHDLLEVPAKRKGLEKKTGGKATASPTITLEDVKKLRENNYTKYTELLIAGKLDHIKE